jgi:adenylate cyclase
MADVFVSYARTDKALVAPLVAAIEGQGFSVWWDPEIAPGQEFDEQIAAELGSARAVVVVWTPVSVASRWVRGEAREAADRGILVPARLEAARLPFDVRAIQTIDLDGWGEDPASGPCQELLRALEATVTRKRDSTKSAPVNAATTHHPAEEAPARLSICVLPFANMSGEPEQEYFSDGISEDIITDLSKVSTLAVTARNTAFTFKGKHDDIAQVSRGSSRSATCSRAACARPASAYALRRSSSTARPAATCGPSATTATSTTSSRCRTRSRRRSSPP